MSRVYDEEKNKGLEPWKKAALQLAIDAADATATRVANYPRALGPVSVAQFLLESAWGKADAGGALNFFGLKARGDEPYVERPTHEVVGGRVIETTARFRRFSTTIECFVAHALLITTRRRGTRLIYERAMQYPANPIAFANALTGVYATDPNYGEKLCRIMADRGLYRTFGFFDPNEVPRS